MKKDLLFKRVLIAQSERGYNTKTTVEEIKILEFSPSGKWVKIQNMNGNKYWKMSVDIVPIEVLESIEKPGN
jgi:hypothetical protein